MANKPQPFGTKSLNDNNHYSELQWQISQYTFHLPSSRGAPKHQSFQVPECTEVDSTAPSMDLATTSGLMALVSSTQWNVLQSHYASCNLCLSRKMKGNNKAKQDKKNLFGCHHLSWESLVNTNNKTVKIHWQKESIIITSGRDCRFCFCWNMLFNRKQNCKLGLKSLASKNFNLQ